MANIIVASDNCFGASTDKACVDQFCQKLNAAGHNATNVGRGPNRTQQYAQTHNCDIMVQIAAGKCIGTYADFCAGIRRGYYKAKKFSIPYWKNEESVMTWKAHKAWDDNFSGNLASKYYGKTLPECYEMDKEIAIFSHGATADAMADMFLKNLGGGTANTNAVAGAATGGGGGTTAFDLIKQVVTPWDKYGVALELDGQTLKVSRATTRNAPILHENSIVADSINITDYKADTPNYITDGKNTLKNDFLIERFGKIEPDEKPDNKGKIWLRDMYQIAQRESGHTIDCKVLFDPQLHEGMYVHLQLPSLNIDGYYFVSKTSVEEESCMSITLDPAPPSRYQEITETTVNTGNTQGTGMGKDAVSIGKALYSKYKFAAKLAQDPGQTYKGCESYECMKQKGNGSCWAWAEALYEECNKAGIKARIIQYRSCSWVSNHRSTQIYQNGEWVDFPYTEAGISKWAKATKYKGNMFVYKQPP